jgi:hypothetical protein
MIMFGHSSWLYKRKKSNGSIRTADTKETGAIAVDQPYLDCGLVWPVLTQAVNFGDAVPRGLELLGRAG